MNKYQRDTKDKKSLFNNSMNSSFAMSSPDCSFESQTYQDTYEAEPSNPSLSFISSDPPSNPSPDPIQIDDNDCNDSFSNYQYTSTLFSQQDYEQPSISADQYSQELDISQQFQSQQMNYSYTHDHQQQQDYSYTHDHQQQQQQQQMNYSYSHDYQQQQPSYQYAHDHQQQDSLQMSFGSTHSNQSIICKNIELIGVTLVGKDLEEAVREKGCAICLENIGENIVIKLGCDHYYHRDCLEPWAKNADTCPTCRQKF